MKLVARSATLLGFVLCAAATAAAQAPEKRPLDHHVYEIWDTIGSPALSPDGSWALYSLIGYDRDGALRVRATAGAAEHAIPRGASAAFSADSRYAAFRISPQHAAVREAKLAKKRADEMPKDSLGILDLETGRIHKVEGVRSFAFPEQAGGWIAYLVEASRDGRGGGESSSTGAGARPGSGGRGGAAADLVLRELRTGVERTFERVSAFAFSKDGARLAYVASTPEGEGDGVYVVEVATGEAAIVAGGKGEYRSLAWDEAGRQLAFLSTRDDAEAETPAYALYHWRVGERAARRVAAAGVAGIPDGWGVSEYGAVRFSRDGRRLFFGTAPRPDPEPEEELLPEERVRVDIWHWQDPLIQTMQLARLQRDRRQNYLAVVHLREGRVVQLADLDVTDVTVGANGDADVAIGVASGPYAERVAYDSPSYADYYLIDVRTGARERFREAAQGAVTLSPGARYAAWYDPQERGWFAMDVRSRRIVALTASFPYPVHNEDHDSPSPPSAYGSAGWTQGDRELLLYDRYDVWAFDPTGRASPRSVTEGVGRREGIRFRVVSFERGEALDPDAPLLLTAFHLRTKDAGFYRDRVSGNAEPERLIYMDRWFSRPIKARDADVFLYARSSFEEFPDLWVAGPDFKDARRISNANPQQAEYRWGTAELVEWTSLDGVPLQGILYKPEDFDPSRKYPMIVYFYERMSDGLHLHYAPIPHRSRINFTFYTSRGYLVFVPDIVYRIGYPGESAMSAVIPGVLRLVERGYVDEENIGVQGHSWGGYQIAYMVTKTDIFKAAAAGAPVANMTSAYGGIRWESGMSRQFQYEKTQSRLGGTLWEMPIRYIENSPLFWLDKVNTPVLIMHNDRDGAVPWYQGIELYMGLRRLKKPAWLINYNDEPHWPTTAANKRDWNIRMQQYFDHFLKGAPPPVWIVEGVPAIKKGRTLGLELVETQPQTATDGLQP